MKFKRTGKYQPLDKIEKKVDLVESLENIAKRTDFLLNYIQDKKPQVLTEYISNLKHQLNELVEVKYIEKSSFDINTVVDKYSTLKSYPELVNARFNLFLNLILAGNDDDWSSQPVNTNEKTRLRSFLLPRYYESLVLTKIVEREDAIDFLKDYLDQYTIENSSFVEKYSDLDEMRKQKLQETKKNPEGEFVVVFSEVKDGKYIIRNDNCPWIDALEDLTDIELIYVTCCHGDFQHVKLMNENFILTRDYTIAEGDPFCDKVFHDKRISNLKHPSQEFIEKMWPLDEWQKNRRS